MNHPKRETPDVPPAIAGTAAGLLPAPDAALDGSIITIAGPNGSGKTTLLDAMRTLLGLDCSGGRSYKTYARHANADTTWLRAGGQPSAWPPDLDPSVRATLLYADQVTLACRIERNGGDWQRRYA
jgi:hypothetical protein